MDQKKAKNAKLKSLMRMLAVCLTVIVGMSVLFLTGCGKQNDQSVNVSYITTKLEGISELATAKMTMRGIIHVEDGKIPLINKKEFYMMYRASVKAGYDLAKAEIEITDDYVIINLPEAELFEIVVDESSLEFFDKTDSWFNQEAMEDTAKAITAAKEDVEAQPEIAELKLMAEEQVKILLEAILEGQIDERTLIINVG